MPFAVLETGKAAVEIKAPIAGKLIKLHAKVGQTVLVGNDFAVIDETQAPPAEASKASKPEVKPAEEKAAPKPAEPVKTMPTATPAPKPTAEPAKKVVIPESEPVKSSIAKFSREVRRVPLSFLRQAASKALKESQNTYAMLTTFNECDMSAFTTMRKELSEDFQKKHGTPLTFMSGFVKAASMSIKKYPAINAVIDGKEIVYRDFVDMSVEVSAQKGILVPVIRNCESLNFAEIEKVQSNLLANNLGNSIFRSKS